jgi:hypothetical protein
VVPLAIVIGWVEAPTLIYRTRPVLQYSSPGDFACGTPGAQAALVGGGQRILHGDVISLERELEPPKLPARVRHHHWSSVAMKHRR